jgi:hypothetical protein
VDIVGLFVAIGFYNWLKQKDKKTLEKHCKHGELSRPILGYKERRLYDALKL